MKRRSRLLSITLAVCVAAPLGVTQIGVPQTAASASLPQVGNLAGEVIEALGAQSWHTAGYTGAGIKIGILTSANSDTWAEQLANDEVPSITPETQTFCVEAGAACTFNPAFTPDSPRLGNALAEIIHDVAPGSEIFLGTFRTVDDMRSVLNSMAAGGVRLVVDPNVYPLSSPGDGTGARQTMVDSVIAASGMLYLKSTGDAGNGRYWRSPTTPIFDANGYLEFAPGDTRMAITKQDVNGASCFWLLGGRWNEWGTPATRTNYDIELWVADGARALPAGLGPNQTATAAPPIELALTNASCTATNYEIRIKRLTTTAGTSNGDIMELFLGFGSLEFSTANGSAAVELTDSRNPAVIAVGNVSLPEPVLAAADHARGPTLDGRIKPDVVAYDCITTSLQPGCMTGSSISTAVTAGVAALLLDANLARANRGLIAMLRSQLVDLGAPGADNDFGRGRVALAPRPDPIVDLGATYTPLTPVRLLDSRSAARSTPTTRGPYEPDRAVTVAVRGATVPGSNPPVTPVPAQATAVAVNITAVNTIRSGYTQVIPYLGAPLESSSTLNTTGANQVRPNFAIVPLGNDGKITIFSTSGGHYIVDLLGYFSPSAATTSGRFVPLAPTRVLDTSSTSAAVLPTGWVAHKPLAAETVALAFKPTGPLPTTGVAGVVISVTGHQPSASGYVTVFPGDVERPVASMLNLVVGRNATNTIIVPVSQGSTRSIKLYSSSGTHLRVDITGYITNGFAVSSESGRYIPITPIRMHDSRRAPHTIVPANTERTFAVGGDGLAIPLNAVAVSGNLTTVNQPSAGSATVYPTGVQPPGTTSLSWAVANEAIAAGAVIGTSADARLSVRPTTAAHVIFDVNGYFTP